MNQLRRLMLEELRRRNFADTTIRSYLHGVEHSSRYFRRRPDQLGQEDIRKYQAALFTKCKLSPNTVILRLAALRFFYIHVLKRDWSIAETPYPKKVRHLPQVLSQEEVARLIVKQRRRWSLNSSTVPEFRSIGWSNWKHNWGFRVCLFLRSRRNAPVRIGKLWQDAVVP